MLDEWNHDGFIVVGTVLPGHSLPACTGIIAEQTGQNIGSQYLRGGAKQAMLKLPEDVASELGAAAVRAEKTGYETIVAGGVRWEFRATGWKDVNGVHGYVQPPSLGSVQIERLQPTSVVTKKHRE